jgi:hypothetical protein
MSSSPSRNVGFHPVPAGKMFNDDLYSFDKTAPKKGGTMPMKTPAAIRMATSMAMNNGVLICSKTLKGAVVQ